MHADAEGKDDQQRESMFTNNVKRIYLDSLLSSLSVPLASTPFVSGSSGEMPASGPANIAYTQQPITLSNIDLLIQTLAALQGVHAEDRLPLRYVDKRVLGLLRCANARSLL